MIQMMTDAGLRAAQNAAYRRIEELEIERRAEIVDAVGRELSVLVEIMGNGGLWTRTDNGEQRAKIIEGLAKAHVNAFSQWTRLPVEDCCNIDEWVKAGRKIGDSGAVADNN